MLIFWDIDGTLMHCGADGTTALNEAFRRLYGIEGAFSAAGIGGAMDYAVLMRIMGSFGIELSELGRIKSLYADILEDVLAADAHKRILPGVEKALEYIEGREGWSSLLLTSNLKSGAEAKLRSVGLSGFFGEPLMGGFGDAPGEKWDAFASALAEARAASGKPARPAETVIIGDSVYDIRCAKRVGARHIAVATGWTPEGVLVAEGPDCLLRDLSDTGAVVNAIERFASDARQR
ncbi:MAG: haloacid dehalogenase-like hydrolase [Clostridiales Family XIII bacterium]|jgi:phosphoglycolate phosphatase-like HAD superfamily hydrolase|nr:haloacid dehalogenase-like hydrolase [Clostridiales Family XIII bacterium]